MKKALIGFLMVAVLAVACGEEEEEDDGGDF